MPMINPFLFLSGMAVPALIFGNRGINGIPRNAGYCTKAKASWSSRFKNIGSRRICQRCISIFRSAHVRRGRLFAGMAIEPIVPAWPPGAFLTDGGSLPAIRIDIDVVFLMGRDLEMTVRMTGGANDASIVAAVRQHESNIG